MERIAMTGQKQDRTPTCGIDMWATIAAYALALLMIVLATQLHAQTFTVLHNFTDGLDGGSPHAGLIMDARGNLYGTASEGANTNGHCYPQGCGGVFELKHTGSSWIFDPLYIFQGKTDSGGPYAGLTFGRDGSLYGTASGTGAAPTRAIATEVAVWCGRSRRRQLPVASSRLSVKAATT